MASGSSDAFRANYKDVERLLEIHTELSGSTPGKKHGVEVLNKSGIVLTCAIWEAYCEDVAAEATDHLVKHAKDSSGIPKGLRARIAQEIKDDPNHIAMWKLSGDGWRAFLQTRIKDLAVERNRQLNTPKTENLSELFENTLGLPKVPSAWYWPGMSAERAGGKLDEYVSMRGDIAHRGGASGNIQKDYVWDFANHVARLVEKTDKHVNDRIADACGVAMF